jgi:LssY C-terminus
MKCSKSASIYLFACSAILFVSLSSARIASPQTPDAAPSPTQENKPNVVTTPRANTTTNGAGTFSFDIPASEQWVDTKITLHAGAKIRITAEGSVSYPKGKTFGPTGLPRTIKDVIHEYAVPDGAHGAVIAQLGSGAGAHDFLVGASAEYDAPVAGKLFVGINQSMKDASAADGGFHVRVEILNPGDATSSLTGPAESRVPGITPDLLAKIPRRISDEKGNPGDMVNIFLIGSEDAVVDVFTSGGWVKVDKGVEKTILAGVEDTMKKEDYLTFPMSTLYLFKRPQDYGFAHAEPVRVLMSRNHLRVWKSPYLVNGRQLWCVAATHDIGFERDQRNNGVTHKIDPAIDGEREYVNQTLSSTGLVIQRDHVMPADPLLTAKTATGGEFHSDGHILVFVLKDKVAKAN